MPNGVLDLRLRGVSSGKGANLTLRVEEGLRFRLLRVLASKDEVEANVVADDGRVLVREDAFEFGRRASESVRGLGEDSDEALGDEDWLCVVIGISRDSLTC